MIEHVTQDYLKHVYVVNPSSGSGGTESGTAASLPAPGEDGRLFFPTNGFYIYRDDGAAWSTWGPIFPLTPPILSDFTALNAGGGATTDTTRGGIFFSAPATPASDNVRAFIFPQPTPPYAYTCGFLPLCPITPNSFSQVGMLFYDSSGLANKCSVLGASFRTGAGGSGNGNGQYLSCTNFTGFPVTSATDLLLINGPLFPNLVWFRIENTGIDRNYYFSADGVNFTFIATQPVNTYLTPSHVGFYIDTNAAASTTVGMTLLHWEKTR